MADRFLGWRAPPVLLLGFLLATGAAPPAPAADGQAAGTGRPGVVFESGLGSGAETWDPVFARIAQETSAFAYGRPGYDKGPLAATDADGKRDADEVARALHRTLERRKIPRPYILVGHSLGGLYVLSFAKLYPKDVAGIVLVDGRMPDFVRACRKVDAPCAHPGPADADAPAHVAAEIDGLSLSEEQAPRPAELGTLPVTVLTRGVGTQPFLGLWQASQDEFASALRNGRHRTAANSRHYIHTDEPDLVVEEIRRMIDAVRGGPGTGDAR